MALAATTIWEVQTGGSDANNGGAFDPGQTAGMFTDGAATVATSAAPVFTSASYNFVAGDVSAWLYIASGTNWIAGWYKIASVAANAATLTATAGAAVLSTRTPTTVTGCATTASPTGATWSIDYSQQAGAEFTYTDITSTGVGLTATSAAHPFGKQQVGNSLVITGGTNFLTGRYVLASVSGVTGTFIGPTNLHNAAGTNNNGAGGMGGALVTLGTPNGIMVSGNCCYVAAGTYVITVGITLTAGATSLNKRWYGYTTVRGDSGKATIQLSGSTITMITMSNANTTFQNFILDANAQTASICLSISSSTSYANNIKCSNFRGAQAVVVTGGASASNIWATGGSSAVTQAFIVNSASSVLLYCIANGNAHRGFTAGAACAFIGCIAANNSGASTDGFVSATSSNFRMVNCIAYGNARDGIRVSVGLLDGATLINNISYLNSGIDINETGTAVTDGQLYFDYNAYATKTGVPSGVHDVVLTADPFINAPSLNFALNTVAGGGAALRGVGFPGVFVDGGSTGYEDLCLIQHHDPFFHTGMAGGFPA